MREYQRRGNRRKYDWELWFGRPETILVRGDHYHCSQSAMSQMVRSNASRRGLRVCLTDTGTEIWIKVLGKREVSHVAN